MALLDEKTREEYLKGLGYGSVRAFQLAVMYPQWVDDKYGPQTDNALRTAWNVHLYCKNFGVKEFRCGCGGKYCGGYPDYMKPSELQHIQTIRDHYGKPITITCGLRDPKYNKSLNGSVQNSGHLTGLAIDFYQAGVTDTVANRKASIKYIRALPNHYFSYGAYMNGTDGIYRQASYMGNAMHTECSNTTPSTPDGKLNVDGVAGGCTIVRIQTVFGMSVKDGLISGQNKSLGKYYPAVIAVQYGKGGSVTVKRLQRWAGAAEDGVWGQSTSRALQKKLNSEGYAAGAEDGVFGNGSVKAFQKWLNDHDTPTPDTPKPAPTPSTLADKIMDACKAQSAWMKNYTYKWENNPTIEKSKKKGTCVTYVACVLQRLGYLPSGGYIWQNGKGYGTGKVYGTNDKMSVTYMGNKPLSSLKNELRKGDIVMVDDNKSGKKGNGGHIFVMTGDWSGNSPYIWDNTTAKKGQKPRKYSGSRKALARVRPKG